MEQTDITAKLEQQTTTNNWLKEEAEKLKSQQFDGERLPALTLEENKIVTFTVDFSTKFKTWNDPENNNIKAIIPVTHNGISKLLWLNLKNPLYSQIVLKGLEGVTTFKVLQTGKQKTTKYTIVED